MAINCWEYTKCGREPGGSRADKLGICPASIYRLFDGYNGGQNAGRFCWKVAGTFCEGEIQGSWAQKMQSCLDCEFYKKVMAEGGHL